MLLSQTDPSGKATLFEYNNRDLLTKRIAPGGRTGTPGAYVYDATKVISYTYDALGNNITRLDPNGNTAVFEWDIHGNLLRQAIGTEEITYTYDNNGNVLTMTDALGTTTRVYDAFNRCIQKTVPFIGTGVYTYDLTTNLTPGHVAESTTDPRGNVTLREYDRSGRLVRVTDTNSTGTAHTVNYTYNADGSVASVLYPDGAREDYTYTIGHLLATLTNNLSDGTHLETYTYTYDPARNLLEKQDAKGTTLYTYDPLGRLQSVTEPSGKITVYTYDPSGNRATQTVTEPGENGSAPTILRTTYTYDPRNRLVRLEKHDLSNAAQAPVLTEVTDYTYDNNGNQRTTTRTTYTNGIAGTPVLVQNNTYDVWNQLVRTETENGTVVENAYNGDGRRVIKTVNGASTYYLYEYDKVILETNVFGDTTGRNVYGLNLLIRTVGVDTFYYMYNGHADVAALLTPSGQVAATYYYDAFGNVLETTGNVDNSILFAGYQYDKETGLYYLNARMYDPITARFMQEDTYLGQKNDPLSLNLYTYCHNSPLMYWDPTGHSAEYRQGGFQFGMNSTADNMAQREARRAMNRTHTGRHINNVAEAAQVSAGHGGDTFKAPTMAYHSPAIVEPLNTGYSHTLDDYAYQQTVSSQFGLRQQAKDAIRNAPSVQQSEDFALIMEALDSFSVNSEYYYELARQDAVNSLIASDKSRLTMAGIEYKTLSLQVYEYVTSYRDVQSSGVVEGTIDFLRTCGYALYDSSANLGELGYAYYSYKKGTGSIDDVKRELREQGSYLMGAGMGIFETVTGKPIYEMIGGFETNTWGTNYISGATNDVYSGIGNTLNYAFDMDMDLYNSTKPLGQLAVAIAGMGDMANMSARAYAANKLAETPIADPYRMSYSGNAQVQMQGFTSSSEAIAFAQNRPASLMRKVAGEGGSQTTALTVYDPQFAARQMLDGGSVSESTLRTMIPDGTPNTFKPSSTIADGYKYSYNVNGTKMEVKWHSADLNAATKFSGSNSGNGWTAQIKVGNKLLGLDGAFYRKPNNLTHIPLIGGGN